MTQVERANAFAALHIKGDPIVLYNIWDSGSARALVGAGACALATGSAPVAMAQGFADGEQTPLEWVFGITSQIVANVDVPLSVDFEGAYARDPETITKNVIGLIRAGAVGVNFEDQIIGDTGLYEIDEQVKRIEAVRAAADATGIPLFINARTDIFLKEADLSKHGALMDEAITRAKAFKNAGANCFFAPLLSDLGLIEQLCDAVDLPVNILKKADNHTKDVLGPLGVARISYGGGAYMALMVQFAQTYKNIS